MTRSASSGYKPFVVGDIFNVDTGSLVPKSELQDGRIPRVTASETTNGIIGTYAPSDHKRYRTLTNFISVSFLGGVFYHPYTASLDMKIHALQIPGVELNEYLGAYIVSALKKMVANFGYGDQLSSTDLPKKKVLLPIDELGNPDWQFMTSYMRTRAKRLMAEYKKHLATFRLPAEQTIGEREWRGFILDDVFKIRATSSSIDRNKLVNKIGQTPYVTRSDNNNGYDGFVGKQTRYSLDNGNVISVGLDTQTAFYQPVDFYTGQNIQVLTNDHINRYTALFVVPRLRELMRKFNWGGNGATLTRLKRSKILLPIDTNGQPDWAYMETYEREIERKILVTRIGDLLGKLRDED